MTHYILELGLDLNAAPCPAGIYPLYSNLAKDQHEPAWYVGLKEGDSLEFRFFDYTTAPWISHDSPLNIEGFVVSIAYADSRTKLVPMTPEQPLCFGPPTIKYKENLQSVAFPELHGGWHLTKGDDKPLVFTLPRPYTERAVLQLKVISTVHHDADKVIRLYGHDPEIIVGPGT